MSEMPDWDAEKWLTDLSERLTVIGNGYMRVDPDDDAASTLDDIWPPAPANRTSFAWLAVIAMTSALQKAPGMANHIGLAPLNDLAAAMIDLGQGGQPKLLRPLKGVGKGRESTVRRVVRQHSLLFVRLLTAADADMTATAACKEVAGVLAARGHSNRKDARERALSWKTVEGWWTRSRQSDFAKRDPRMAAFLDRTFGRITAAHGGRLTLVDARKVMNDIADMPAMRSKG